MIEKWLNEVRYHRVYVRFFNGVSLRKTTNILILEIRKFIYKLSLLSDTLIKPSNHIKHLDMNRIKRSTPKRILYLYLICFCSSVVLLSCGSHKGNRLSRNTEDLVIYPAPPDTTRIQYLTSISSSLSIGKKQSAFNKLLFGETSPMFIRKPYGVTINNGKIYVCDLDIAGLEIIDLKNNTFEYFVPKGLGQLKTPINCHIDDKGQLYISDSDRGQVVIFDKDLRFVDNIGEKENFRPTDVFVHRNKIYIVNVKDHFIRVYNRDDFSFLHNIPNEKEESAGKIFTATNLYVNDSGVYVSDMGDFSIKRYGLDGDFISKIGNLGSNLGQLVRPKGVAVDRESNVYVVDSSFENAQIFNNKGELLMFFGGPYRGPGDMYLPAKIAIDYENLEYFESLVDERFTLEYLILVSNQFGPDKINVYGKVRNN